MVNAVSTTFSYTTSSLTGNAAQDALKALLKALQATQSGSSPPAANSQTSSTNPPSQLAQNLFSLVNTSGSGSTTESDLEQAVTQAGGTKQAADALWSQLDPSGASSITEQQFAQNLPKPPAPPQLTLQQGVQDAQAPRHHHHHGGGADTSPDTTDDTLLDSDGITPSSSGNVLDTTA